MTTDSNTTNTSKGTNKRKAAIAAVTGSFVALFLFAAFNFFGQDDQPEPVTTDQVAADAQASENFVPQDDSNDDRLSGDSRDDVIVGNPDDDVIPSLPGNDVIGGSRSDDIISGDPDDDVITTGQRSTAEDPRDPFLQELCIDVRHQPVPDQDSATGIWVRGSVYGLPHDSWIWVEGPSLNNGNPVQIPVGPDGSFDGGIGINQYGDHELTRFDLWNGESTDQPVDLLPSLLQEFDAPTIPVGPDEGSPFDQDCFTFDEPTPDQPESNPAELNAQAEEFLDAFVLDHANQDVDHLGVTLHPAVTLAFGQDTCVDYVNRTVGSITGIDVLDVAGPMPFELPTPDGLIGFPEVIDVHAELTLSSGDVQVIDIHLPLHDGDAYWLTQCGVDTP